MNEEKMAIYKVLNKNRFTSVKDLVYKTGLPDRKIRILCSSMVQDDEIPLISSNSCTPGRHGYKIAASVDELKSASRLLRSHADAEYLHAFKLDMIAKDFS
ncbi:hypothetical protein ACKP2L_05165 [Oenococcus alcoholitolerans]|uniref:hypothetical protein n=1 Tax=Oenococcus alcoholitolerans TaxID=931074 RepID=UPI003F71C5E9